MRTNMTTLTQTWMTLLLSNILPSDHNSDLPLPKCQLVYAILTRMSIHVAQLIANAIYIFAGRAPTRHPLDPDKSNRALGFPAPQGPVGLIWVQRVPGRRHTCKNIDGISD